FFLLFTLLMHHAYPEAQWQFQFCFGGALLVASAFAREPGGVETMFAQGVVVATLGLISYLEGGKLAAALAVESLLLLWLARWMSSRWLPWIARAAFGVAFWTAWPRYPGLWTAWFASAVGFVCARSENRT